MTDIRHADGNEPQIPAESRRPWTPNAMPEGPALPSPGPPSGRRPPRRRGANGWPAVLAALLLVVGFLLALTLVACGSGGPSGPPGETTLERIQRTGVVRVGYANEAPYAYFDRQENRLTGEAVEVARKVFEGLGAGEVEGVLTEFGSLIPGLKARRFDVIAAGMYVTPPRCGQISFSQPTYSIGEAFVVAAGNPLNLHSYESVAEKPEASLGVVAGAVNLGYARAVGVPDSQILLFPDAPSAVEAVISGRADAYAGTSLTVQDLLSKSPEGKVERAEPFTDPVIEGRSVRGYGAFGVHPEDEDLLQAVNEQLEGFIGTEEHRSIVAPFGFTEADLPGEVTVEELCRPQP